MTDPDPDFAWLREPRHRRRSLRLVERSIHRGDLLGDHPDLVRRRAALMEVLLGLLDDGSLADREPGRCSAASGGWWG